MGVLVQIDNFSRDFGRPSVVWRLTGSDGSRVWLKHHEGAKQYRRELIGLERYVPALGAQTWWCSPALVAKDDKIDAILITDIKGEIFESTTASADEEWAMFRLAGRFVRKLYQIASSVTLGYVRGFPDLRFMIPLCSFQLIRRVRCRQRLGCEMIIVQMSFWAWPGLVKMERRPAG